MDRNVGLSGRSALRAHRHKQAPGNDAVSQYATSSTSAVDKDVLWHVLRVQSSFGSVTDEHAESAALCESYPKDRPDNYSRFDN